MILELAIQNKGIVTAAMVKEKNLSAGVLKYLCDNGRLEKTTRGVYMLPASWDDEFINLQGRFKKGIFSHETALFLHNLTDRTSIKFHMTFPTGYNLTMAKTFNVKCHQNKIDIYNTGIVNASTPFENTVRVYCPEKTLCDILVKKSETDIELISTAYKIYKDSNEKNIPLLSEYAKMLRVEKKVRTYLEVLL